MKNQSEERKRKLFGVLPLLVFPFITVFFWAFDGGQAMAGQSKAQEKKGFNASLPDAKLRQTPGDKMSYYNQVASDSARQNKLSKNDPYFRDSSFAGQFREGEDRNHFGLNSLSSGNGQYKSPDESRIYSKLSELNSVMNAPAAAPANAPTIYKRSAGKDQDIDRLQQMMESMSGKEEDPEMTQMNAMLDRLLDVQHPDRVQQRIKEHSKANKGKVFRVSSNGQQAAITMIGEDTGRLNSGSGFYGLAEGNEQEPPNSINAVVHQQQVIINGSIVKLRLQHDIYVAGARIPKGSFVFGKASLSGERLNITIESLTYGSSVFPVQLDVYDLDGMDGIHIPGAISREVAKSSADGAIQGVGLNSFDPSIGMQAAGVGIEAVKNLVGKKVKLVKVTLKAGYKVLLFDHSQDKN